MRNAVIGLLYRSTTNLFKPLVGKKKFQLQQDKFVILYLRHLFSFKKIPLMFKLTSSPRSNEGACSQALLSMYAMIFSRISNMPYRHSPFTRLAHADRPMDQFAMAWEDYFNLSKDAIDLDKDDSPVINFSACFHHIQWVYTIKDYSVYFPEALPSFKEKYFFNKPSLKKKKNHIVVGIHVRRGDVNRMSYPTYWTDTQVVHHCVAMLVSIFEDRQLSYELHLYSQGDNEDFEVFSTFDIKFHLDEDPLWCHGQLVNADVLIMAKSTYSYVAALLNEGVILYEPNNVAYKMSPLPHWIKRSTKGDFDTALCVEKINELEHISVA